MLHIHCRAKVSKFEVDGKFIEQAAMKIIIKKEKETQKKLA